MPITSPGASAPLNMSEPPSPTTHMASQSVSSQNPPVNIAHPNATLPHSFPPEAPINTSPSVQTTPVIPTPAKLPPSEPSSPATPSSAKQKPSKKQGKIKDTPAKESSKREPKQVDATPIHTDKRLVDIISLQVMWNAGCEMPSRFRL